MKSGQILILVLLVIVVVLAVGLSVASRNITNMRTATQSEQSQRAFSAAEGGIEKVLSGDLNAQAAAGPLPLVQVGDQKAKVTVVGSKKFENTIPLGNVGQIDLGNASSGREVKIEWARNDKANEVNIPGPASIEITQVYGESPYFQKRYFAQGIGSRFESEKLAPGSVLSTACSGFVESGEFKKCTIVTTEGSAKILRIKPFWDDTTVRVSGAGGFELPVQTFDVTSTATTENGVTRRVQVIKTAQPQLPAVFDYVLYSEGQISK